MAHFAREHELPRRVLLARHFDLPEEGLDFGCDNTADGAAWRAAHGGGRERIPAEAPEAPSRDARAGTLNLTSVREQREEQRS